MGLYLRPTALADALAALADPELTQHPEKIDRLMVLAGGTDVYPAKAARSPGWGDAAQRARHLSHRGTARHRQDAGGVSFGALATWTDIRAELPPRSTA